MAGKIASLLLLVILVGGLNVHWVVLQLFGWSAMSLDYRAENLSWSQAVDRAVSGETPCQLCKTVDAAMTASAQLDNVTTPARSVEISPLPWLPLVPTGQQAAAAWPPEPWSHRLIAADQRPAGIALETETPPPRLKSA